MALIVPLWAVAFEPVRSRMALLINRNLFAYRYDYRDAWLRFIDTLASEAGRPPDRLPQRVIRAVADVVGTTGGAIWAREADGRFRLLAARHLPRPAVTLVEAPGLAKALLARGTAVEIRSAAAVLGQPLPPWLPPASQAWLVVPLIHRRGLVGLMVLAHPRVPRALDWEDQDLLRILARQAASYITEDMVARTLAEASEFVAFNRRSTFILHDLKNLAAQLSLTLENAQRHRRNPAFIEDMMMTLEEAVARLDRVMGEVHSRNRADLRREVDLGRLLRDFARSSSRRPRLVTPLPHLRATVDEEQLRVALHHLVVNAFEAVDERGRVEIELRAGDDAAVIEVRDNGPGVELEHVAQGVFRPFVTTKPQGLGIGLFQARALVEQQGGRLEVDSRRGIGTTMRIFLPFDRS